MIRELICWKCTCAKCGHQWTTKTHDLPRHCAKCKTQTWNDDYDRPAALIETQQFTTGIEPVDAVTAQELGPTFADDEWIDDPVTYENGEVLHWHHKPKCKPVCYRRESDLNGA